MAAVRAGAATADITPAPGVAMGGYGARQGVASGAHDPLMVRSLVIDDGVSKIAIAVCDLVGVSTDIVDEARRLIEAEVGLRPANVVIAATHTHSGPAALRERDSAGYAATVARKVADSVRAAIDRFAPATLKLGSTEVTTVSQNRRHPDGPIEPTLQVLAAEPADGVGENLGTLVAYACHATVLEHDNLEWSADFPAAAAGIVERAVGGTAVYLQGACGDINPVWLRHDFAEAGRIGAIVGASAARLAAELRPVGRQQRVVNLSWSEDLDVPATRGAVLEPVTLAARSRRISLTRRPLPRRDEIARKIREIEVDLEQITDADVALRRRLGPRLSQLRMEWLFAGPEGREAKPEEIEVQVLRLSPQCALVALPHELVVGIARDIEAVAPTPHVLLAGYANGYFGYVPRAEDFPKGGYEVGSARFEEGTAQLLVDTVGEMLVELYQPAGSP